MMAKDNHKGSPKNNQEHITPSINPDAQAEATAAGDQCQEFKRLKQLIGVTGDVLDVIAEKTNGARDDKFVSTFVRACINYWQSDLKS
jgi:hypothetical protein